MKTAHKTLTFPLGGVFRQRSYRRQTKPYSSPWAVNVRGEGSLEDRSRGGSRPGLVDVTNAAVTGITAMVSIVTVSGDTRTYHLVVIANGSFYLLSGLNLVVTDSNLLAEDGTAIFAEDGQNIIFGDTVSATSPIGATGAYTAVERSGKLYLADSSLREYDPLTGVVRTVIAEEGTIPTSQPLISLYRDRIILGGANHLWYASRQSDPTDWDYGADMGDEGRAVAGQLAIAGRIGDTPTAISPLEDKALVFACKNSMYVINGDPATGQMDVVSEDIGVIATNAWAKSPDGLLAFLSNDGVYVWGAGSRKHPVRFSMERMPKQLKNVSTANKISMEYDHLGKGFHLFITPSSGTEYHWWLNIEEKACWPVLFGEPAHQPVATAMFDDGNLRQTLLAAKDGIIYKFSRASTEDAGDTEIKSHVLIGAFRLAANDTHDALLAELHGIMGDNTGNVTWRVFTGDSAEGVVDKATEDLDKIIAGTTPVNVLSTGTWSGGRNAVTRPRNRGAWCVLCLSANGKWAYEAIAIVTRQLGRIRQWA